VNRHAVTPYGRTGGSSRVRVHSWVERLDDRPVVHDYLGSNSASPSVLVHRPAAVAAAERDLRRLIRHRPDWLLLHREASPLSRGGLERSLVKSASFSVYDFDDALHLDTGAGAWWRSVASKARKAQLAAANVDRVVAGNEILADWADTVARDVRIVPSCVDTASYSKKTDYRTGDPPVLAWIGSRDNEQLLVGIADALREVHRLTGARILLIGQQSGSLEGLEQLVDRVQWSEETQHHLLARADVGLMPLDDDPYSRGKCGYKLLQYAAAGLPAVGSPVGTNAGILKALGLPGATSDAEWRDHLLELLTLSTEQRRALGLHTLRAVEAHYSYEAWDSRWRAAMGLPPRSNDGWSSRGA